MTTWGIEFFARSLWRIRVLLMICRASFELAGTCPNSGPTSGGSFTIMSAVSICGISSGLLSRAWKGSRNPLKRRYLIL